MVEEKKLSYEDQRALLSNYGDVRDLINNQDFLVNLLSSEYDRHMIGTLMDMVNEKIDSGELEPEHLNLLRSGFLVERILELPELARNKGRNMFPLEIGDKLNYLSSIHDVDTLIATYANKNLIDEINRSGNSEELTFWISSGTLATLPLEVQTVVVEKFIDSKNIDLAERVIKKLNSSLARARKEAEMSKEKQEIHESLASMFK